MRCDTKKCDANQKLTVVEQPRLEQVLVLMELDNPPQAVETVYHLHLHLIFH
jgi:hypothetical protein